MTREFLQARIDATKALITVYEDALTALGSGVQSYTLDTGQSRQVVTKLDLKDLNDTLDGLYNRLATLDSRLNGTGTAIGRPGW